MSSFFLIEKKTIRKIQKTKEDDCFFCLFMKANCFHTLNYLFFHFYILIYDFLNKFSIKVNKENKRLILFIL